MTRFPDWRPRLHGYLASSARVRFRPGSYDCGMFAAGAVEAMTGLDPAARYRGTYRTMREIADKLRADGHADHIAFVASMFAEIPPAMAGTGDLAAVPDVHGGLGLGVITGPNIAVVHPAGMNLVALTDAKRAFRV